LDRILEGGCACGTVRFRAAGKPLWVAHCHCRSCRKQTGSPFTTYAGYRREAVGFSGTGRGSYNSSPGVTRSFCPRCGTPLAYEGERWPGEIHLFLASFDDPNALRPTAHVHVSEQLDWIHLADRLPRFAMTSKEGPAL
jgi:hypothetical protein